MEQTFEVKPVGIRYMCGKCDKEMEYSGQMIIENGQPLFYHTCRCGNEEKLNKKYPTVEHKYI